MKLINFFTCCLISFVFLKADVCLSFSNPSSASSGGEISEAGFSSIDIRSLVKVQIDSARARELRGEIKSFINYVNAKTNVAYHLPKPVDIETDPFFDLKIQIIVGFSLVAFLVVFTRRIKNKFETSKKVSVSIEFPVFKSLVASLRKIKSQFWASKNKKLTENTEFSKAVQKKSIIRKEDTELSSIRSKLVNLSASEIPADSISLKAKDLKISKGEVFLAAKIKSYQLAHLGSHSK